jgi:cytochrome c553
MNKFAFATLIAILSASLAMAQGAPVTIGTQGGPTTPIAGTPSASTSAFTGNVQGVLNYIPNYDVMGAHENGGRGCAGCHAPHNGAKGSGGNVLGATGYSTNGVQQGGLWGTDTGAILTFLEATPLVTNGGLSAHSGILTMNGANNWADPNYTGVATCLSCHDGSVSLGAMMSGQAYEQVFGLLGGAGVGLNTNRNGGLSTQLYGPNPIPTLLGGGVGLGYAYQHPIGQTANMASVLGSVITNAAYGLAPAVSNGSVTVANIVANTPYGNFVASYYPGALASTVSRGTGNFADNYVVCTTCHNQHNMAVYGGGQPGESVPAGVVQVRTIFFVNGGYNPGAPYDPTHVPSTMRFCQQWHFSFSSEFFGATNIGTAY